MAAFLQHYKSHLSFFSTRTVFFGARGGAVDGGTALKTGRLRVRFPMVPLQFSIDTILPAELWPWSRLSL
jgi:hypothetical protein